MLWKLRKGDIQKKIQINRSLDFFGLKILSTKISNFSRRNQEKTFPEINSFSDVAKRKFRTFHLKKKKNQLNKKLISVLLKAFFKQQKSHNYISEDYNTFETCSINSFFEFLSRNKQIKLLIQVKSRLVAAFCLVLLYFFR